MLVSKKTYCFSCKEPTWIEGKFETYLDEYCSSKKLDICTNCGCKKITTEEGCIAYYSKDGKEINKMLR